MHTLIGVVLLGTFGYTLSGPHGSLSGCLGRQVLLVTLTVQWSLATLVPFRTTELLEMDVRK